jgi:protein-tyrosine kinase
MSRLHEALERAQAYAGKSVDQPAAVPMLTSEGVVPALPTSWQIEPEEYASHSVTESESVAEPAAVESESDADDFEFQYEIPINPTSRRLIVGPEMDRALIEQYRRLAATLHHAQLRTGDHTVLIASAVAAEGKTLTATNVALTLGHSYRRRVLLVDADLRCPSIHKLFSLDNRIGLRDTLKPHTADGKLPVHQVSPTLWIMTAGRPDPDPMSGLVSDTMKQFLVEASEQFDWVVIDTPPVALLPDANLLAAMVDAALLVVSANTTPYPLVTRAIDAIGPARILGVVLNRADPAEARVGYGYYNYDSSSRSAKKRQRWSPFTLVRRA